MTTRYCKRCDRDVPLADWSFLKRSHWPEAKPRDRCKECQNRYQRSIQSTPEGKARLVTQYQHRKAAGLIVTVPWGQKTEAQRKAQTGSLKRHRARNGEKTREMDRQYKFFRRHPGYRTMLMAIRAHYGAECMCCRVRPGVCTDHVVPLQPESPASLNDWPNIQLLCRICNTQKRLLRTDYRPDGGAFILAHLVANPALSTQSLALYKRPKVTRHILGATAYK